MSSSIDGAEMLLIGEEDRYDGITVKIDQKMDVAVFLGKLRASISTWKQQGKTGVWLQIPIDLAILIPAAVEEGFRYHHADPAYLMLVKWLPERPDVLPIYATHRLGVGAVVVNDNKEILVVQEKSGHFRGSDVWKIPTGVVEEGEDILSGAEREVKEEAGVEAEFVEILGFRESHKAHFKKISDLFFVCLLKPKTFNITEQDSEIAAAKWMPVEEYAAQPYVMQRDSMRKTAEMILAKLKAECTGFTHQKVKSTSNEHTLYQCHF